MSMLINYTWEVMDVGKTNGVDNSIARDMFVANLNNYGIEGAEFYPGADVDYEALSAQWKALTPAEQGDEKILLKKFMTDCYDELSETRRVGSKAKYYDILLNYKPETVEKSQYYLFDKAWDVWDKASKDGNDLMTSLDAVLADDPTWAAFDDTRKTAEKEWFGYAVATYDKGLIYAYDIGDKSLFESILSTR